MKPHRTGIITGINFVAQYVGPLVVVWALTYGVFGDSSVGDTRLAPVSWVLAGAGIGLSALSIKLSSSEQRIDALEEELGSLRRRLVVDEAQAVRDRND